MAAAEEVRARGAHTIVITDNPQFVEGVADDIIAIKQGHHSFPLPCGVAPGASTRRDVK